MRVQFIAAFEWSWLWSIAPHLCWTAVFKHLVRHGMSWNVHIQVRAMDYQYLYIDTCNCVFNAWLYTLAFIYFSLFACAICIDIDFEPESKYFFFHSTRYYVISSYFTFYLWSIWRLFLYFQQTVFFRTFLNWKTRACGHLTRFLSQIFRFDYEFVSFCEHSIDLMPIKKI